MALRHPAAMQLVLVAVAQFLLQSVLTLYFTRLKDFILIEYAQCHCSWRWEQVKVQSKKGHYGQARLGRLNGE